jgi:hypothetical protein
MSEIKFVNLKNLPIQSYEMTTSKIKEYQSLQKEVDETNKQIKEFQERVLPVYKNMAEIMQDLSLWSVSVKYIDGSIMFSDATRANEYYQLLLEAGIAKGNVILEYTNEDISGDLSNVDIESCLTQDFVNDVYNRWLYQVEKRIPKKSKWDYAADDESELVIKN